MANALIAKGFDVVGFDPAEEAQRWLVANGGRFGEHDQILADCPTIVLAVVDEEQIRHILFDGKNKVRQLNSRANLLCTSTVSPTFLQEIAPKVAPVSLLDAPVSGGAARALKGELAMYLSGDPQVIADVRPILSAVSSQVFEVGDSLGTASTFKLINQILAAGNLLVASEAVALAEEAGIDLPSLSSVIGASAGHSWMFDNVASGRIEEIKAARSAVSIFLKDIKIAQAFVAGSAVRSPTIHNAAVVLNDAVNRGFGSADAAALVSYLRGMDPELKSYNVHKGGENEREV
tara:strand:+ start:2609 stop:3481 length:873 start_codon:yes stop_codon:yes gene_type:complete